MDTQDFVNNLLSNYDLKLTMHHEALGTVDQIYTTTDETVKVHIHSINDTKTNKPIPKTITIFA